MGKSWEIRAELLGSVAGVGVMGREHRISSIDVSLTETDEGRTRSRGGACCCGSGLCEGEGEEGENDRNEEDVHIE